MVCLIVGFVYAWLYLPGVGKGDPTGGKVGMAHLYLGTIVMGLAGMQVRDSCSWTNVVHLHVCMMIVTILNIYTSTHCHLL